MVSVAVMHTTTKNSLGKKGFFIAQVTVHHLGKSRQELEAESMQVDCLLAWSQTHTQLLFLHNPNPQPRDSTTYKWAGGSGIISKQENALQTRPQDNLMGAILQLKLPFLSVPR